MRAALLILAAWIAASLTASAGERETPGFELRLGVLAHDVFGAENGSVDLAGGLLVPLPFRPDGRFAFLMPRLEIAGVLSPSRRTSAVHAGASWQFDLAGPIFAEFGLGVALHDGATGPGTFGQQSAMGCRFAFRESAGLGYRLGHGWNVLAGVEHYSNAGICERNRGLTHAGIRLGYAF